MITTDLPMKSSTKRWKRAQKAEAAAWSKPHTKKLTHEICCRNLECMCKHTGITEDELSHMTILEIGGTVVEESFDNPNIAPKLSIDPLFPFSYSITEFGKCCQRVKGIGEYLPLSDNSIDLCWCANVLDHTFSPITVLQEIRRVLEKTGILIISCELFPAWTKPLFPLFNVFDSPHPYHYTLSGFKILMRREFEIKKEVIDRVLYLSLRRNHQFSLTRDLKNKLAGVVRVRYIYFICIPLKKII